VGRPAAGDTIPLAIATTQANGYFSAPWRADRLQRAFGTVSGGPPIDVPLDDDRLPHRILLVTRHGQFDEPDHPCDCGEPPPRALSQDDLTGNPTAYSQDLGGGCIDLTMPNRVLEEFTYQLVVRTTDPRVRGVSTTTTPRPAAHGSASWC
jgi:hypothetical protein